MLVVYEGYQKDFSGFGHSPSALQMNEDSISSTFVNDDPHTSDGCYDGDINNSSPDCNVTMEKEISQTSTLRRGFAEATVKETKRIASFYPTRFVIDSFLLISVYTLSLIFMNKKLLLVPS